LAITINLIVSIK